MATGEQLKALLRSYAAGDEERFRTTALQIAAYSARNGSTELAKELRDLVDSVPRRQAPVGLPGALPMVRPSAELIGLLTASNSWVRTADMVLPAEVRDVLRDVVSQYRQREKLRHHGLSPQRRLLLIGPPGCGKSMTAYALAGECSLPLMSVKLHTLITRHLGETAAKLRRVFNALSETRGVYLFDEFDAIGAACAAGNNVGDMCGILSSFLQCLEEDESESIIVAATNPVEMLDVALVRRFDEVIRYELPDAKTAREVIENRLARFDLANMDWAGVLNVVKGLSHGDLVKASDEAARKAVLAETKVISPTILCQSLQRRRTSQGLAHG